MATAKEQLRRSIRRVRDSIPPAAAADAARAAAIHLLALAPAAAAGTVGVYVAAHGELDPATLVRGFLGRGVRLAYPRVERAGEPLVFHEVAMADDGPTGLRPGTFGIMEPPASAALVPLDAIDLFVVPGLAFDETGARLGWGLGYYDRTLARHPAAVRVGYCFACQIVPHVPHGQGDVPMHYVVSEVGASGPVGEPGT